MEETAKHKRELSMRDCQRRLSVRETAKPKRGLSMRDTRRLSVRRRAEDEREG